MNLMGGLLHLGVRICSRLQIRLKWMPLALHDAQHEIVDGDPDLHEHRARRPDRASEMINREGRRSDIR